MLKNEDEHSDQGTNHSDTENAEARRDADRGRHPKTRRGGQSLNLALFVQLQYSPCADESDTRDHALDHSG